jgi:ParB-like chromosome segregation protein Spo0J
MQTLKVGRFTVGNVPVDRFVLLDRNARFMKNEQFQRLVANIKEDGQLSQFPFCLKFVPEGFEPDEWRLLVLSGNHRVKAGMAAGLEEIPAIWTDDPLPREKQLAIQLSHNAIVGEDDPVVLAELWKELSDVSAKLYSGLDDKVMNALPKPDLSALGEVRLDFRTVSFLFLPEEQEQLKDAFAAARDRVKGHDTYLARFADFDRLLDGLAKVEAAYDVKNGATALLLMLALLARHQEELAEGWFDPETEEATHKGRVPLATIFGGDTMPADAAAVVKKAVDKMVREGDVDRDKKWRVLEFLAAEYLATAGQETVQ